MNKRVRFHLKERAWTLTEDFIIRDDGGNAVLEVRGAFFHIGDDLRMYDRQSRQEVARIRQQLISITPSYAIYRNGQHWAEVHEQLIQLFGERFKVTGENGMVFHIDGDLWNWNFAITDNNGNLMARVGREFSIFRDSYAVDVAQGVDVPFVVSLALVLEMVKEHHERRDR
jgi:uncharacterized protein YxjI